MAIAAGMNRARKVVFSGTLEKADWSNTEFVRHDIAGRVRALKEQAGPGMAVLGSGTIVSQLAREELIDELQVVVVPVALGGGRTLFDGIGKKLNIKLTRTRVFGNGNVLLCYAPGA